MRVGLDKECLDGSNNLEVKVVCKNNSPPNLLQILVRSFPALALRLVQLAIAPFALVAIFLFQVLHLHAFVGLLAGLSRLRRFVVVFVKQLLSRQKVDPRRLIAVHM